jgi:hypothetical protein
VMCPWKSVFRIRIRIGSGFNEVIGILKFHVLKCWMFPSEGWRLLL